MKILGIESSCDECSVAIVESSGTSLNVLAEATFSQVELHRPFGGVVPEVASRNHLETIHPLIEQVLTQAGLPPSQLDGVAVANRPGLIGSLLVGMSAAKAFAYLHQLPLIPVNHLDGHVASLLLAETTLSLPALVVLVSGGHTQIRFCEGPSLLTSAILARSRDDAAGEAFDKTAKLLGYGYPGGIHIDRGARKGDGSRFKLPRPLPGESTMDLSFSGIKTAVASLVRKIPPAEMDEARLHLCASIESAIVGHLMEKIRLARRETNASRVGVAGGVAANTLLREELKREFGAGFVAPPLPYCTDNGAMIAVAGMLEYLRGTALRGRAVLELSAVPS